MKKLFENISHKDKELLLKQFYTSTSNYKKGAFILSNIDNNSIGIVLEGYLQIIKTDYYGNITIIEELKEGNIFGSTISQINDSETEILVKDNSKIMFIEYDMIFNSNTKKNYLNQFLKNLLHITIDVINEKNIRIQILTKKTIRDKLLEYFSINTNTNKKYFTIPFSYTNLAAYLAIDRSAMSRELTNLKEDGLIETKGRTIYIKY